MFEVLRAGGAGPLTTHEKEPTMTTQATTTRTYTNLGDFIDHAELGETFTQDDSATRQRIICTYRLRSVTRHPDGSASAVVDQVMTLHDPHGKRYRTRLSRGRTYELSAPEDHQLRFVTYNVDALSAPYSLGDTPVARYSKAALVAEHAALCTPTVWDK